MREGGWRGGRKEASEVENRDRTATGTTMKEILSWLPTAGQLWQAHLLNFLSKVTWQRELQKTVFAFLLQILPPPPALTSSKNWVPTSLRGKGKMRPNSLHIFYHLRKAISWSECFMIQRITCSLVLLLSTSARPSLPVFMPFFNLEVVLCPRSSLSLPPIQNLCLSPSLPASLSLFLSHSSSLSHIHTHKLSFVSIFYLH